ncbi:hypothetical protein VD0004_g743 [Verticillium dahliae]|nr:hypothetical protein VD0004_g743 [Verticillium dahliae]
MPFRIIIVGAGIAGLCAAIGLAQQGHDVTIPESAKELTPIGVGIHIPPNAALVLKHFGILERMTDDAIHPTKFVFRIKSKLRNDIIPEEDTSMNLNPLSAFRAYVHHDDLMSDPITAPIFKEIATNVWAGYNRHVIIYPCAGGMYTLGATHPANHYEIGDQAMEWSRAATVSQAEEEYQEWNPIVKRILHHTKEVGKWRLAEVPRLPRWASKSGRVVLMGDNAHAMLQFLAQGAAMATEDAGSLSVAVSRAKSAEDLPRVLRLMRGRENGAVKPSRPKPGGTAT